MSPAGCESIVEVVDIRELFAQAFHTIMSSAEYDMRYRLGEYFMGLVKVEAEKLLVYIKNDTVVGYGCWRDICFLAPPSGIRYA